MNLTDKINELGISQIYNYVMETNPSSDLPYHNNFHLDQVCKFALLGADYYQLSDNDKKLLAISALFHDYNHTGSGKNDDINIENAINAFIEFNNQDIKKFKSFLTEDESNKVIDLIKATRYPYMTDPKTLLQQILRDSDFLQGMFCEDYINKIVMAIAKENGIPPKVMLQNQSGLLNSIKFCTKWANDMHQEGLPTILSKVESALKS